MFDFPAAENLTSKPMTEKWVLHLRTHFGNAWIVVLFVVAGAAFAQAPQATNAGPVTALYRRINSVGLDPKLVYNVRGAAIDREDLHVSLDDGTIAFTQEVDGRITGALFVGEGTVLIVPPDNVERHSLGMFTGSAVLNRQFNHAYFRFYDSHFLSDLRPYLRALDDPQSFLQENDALVKALAPLDSLRLLLSMTREARIEPGNTLTGEFMHGRFVGATSTFDASWDTAVNEQISAGQTSYNERGAYYDQWMLFPMRTVRQRDAERLARGVSNDTLYEDEIKITNYKVRTRVTPPTELAVDATMDIKVRRGGSKVFLFELSRYLKVSSVTLENAQPGAIAATVPLEFIQNEAIEGTDLARRGNDLIAIAFPHALKEGEQFKVHLVYSGSVLSDAGGGLLYVGGRGAWYPNRGPMMSNFDLEFESPLEWKLLATGKLSSRSTKDGVETTHWISERPIPLAGFNLGRYTAETEKTTVGQVDVTAYATQGLESAFPSAQQKTEVIIPSEGAQQPILAVPQVTPLVPAHNARMVAEKARDTIDFLAPHLGAYPYSSLELTQMPGPDSQGWPGLIFLSSHVFLTPAQRAQGRGSDYATSPEELIYSQLMVAHETAHQWWGDAVLWQSYRDQWLMEALANYSALLEMEATTPQDAKDILDFYREELETPARGETTARKEAGPVSFGLRLNSAPFPNAYEAVAYGRGTWLIHMIREVLRNPSDKRDPDAVFYSMLRGLQQKYAGKAMSTQDLQLALEEVWPASLRYEGKKSLGWFFDGWVNGTSVPKIELKSVKFSEAAGKKIARANLVQSEAPDSLVTVVPIYAETAGGLVFVERVFADGNETALKLTVPTGTKKLVVDPFETVLRVK
jgi:hypothetical protein